MIDATGLVAALSAIAQVLGVWFGVSLLAAAGWSAFRAPQRQLRLQLEAVADARTATSRRPASFPIDSLAA